MRVYTPPDSDIARCMASTGMQRMQAIYHLRGRQALQTAERWLAAPAMVTPTSELCDHSYELIEESFDHESGVRWLQCKHCEATLDYTGKEE